MLNNNDNIPQSDPTYFNYDSTVINFLSSKSIDLIQNYFLKNKETKNRKYERSKLQNVLKVYRVIP